MAAQRLEMIRTPDGAFEGLPGYPYPANYLTYRGGRLHYVSEGIGPPVLCLSGWPAWSYLFRKMIPQLRRDCQVIAPDLIGTGRSDKYLSRRHYSLELHYGSLMRLMEDLGVDGITLVAHGTSACVGLALLGKMPERFSHLVLINPLLPDSSGHPPWRIRLAEAFCRHSPWLPLGRIVSALTRSQLQKPIEAAYAAPFPDGRYMPGIRSLSSHLPHPRAKDGRKQLQRAFGVLKEWGKPALVIRSEEDERLTGHSCRRLEDMMGERLTTIPLKGAGHLLPEDKGDEAARAVLRLMGLLREEN